MICEIALLTIDPADAQAFEAAVAAAAPLFRAAAGCHAMGLERSIDIPGRYRLVVRWESVEHHMVGFRQSEGFVSWRTLTSPYFTTPPEVEHVATVAQYF